MRIRSLAALAAAVAVAASAAPSHANPFVGRATEATATVKLRGSDGKSYAVGYRFNALAPHGGEKSYTLDIQIAKCSDGTCGQPKRYTVQLTAGQVTATDDMSEVTVRVPTLGTTLNLEWRATTDADPLRQPLVVRAAVLTTSAQNGPQPAAFRATAWGAGCGAPGEYRNPTVIAAEGYFVERGVTPPRGTPPQFAKKGRRVPGCVT